MFFSIDVFPNAICLLACVQYVITFTFHFSHPSSCSCGPWRSRCPSSPPSAIFANVEVCLHLLYLQELIMSMSNVSALTHYFNVNQYQIKLTMSMSMHFLQPALWLIPALLHQTSTWKYWICVFVFALYLYYRCWG